MQGDGNLGLYSHDYPTWASYTAGYPGAYLNVQNDGNMVLYHGGTAIWSSLTGRL